MLPYPLLLFLVIGASAFQVKEQLPEEFLLGGLETSFGQFPAAAYIVSPERELCGATVLNANHVLTLAQCVLNATHNTINPRLVRVHAGVLDLDSVSPHRQTRLGDVIFVHPNFKAHSLENDVAVIRVRMSSGNTYSGVNTLDNFLSDSAAIHFPKQRGRTSFKANENSC